MLLQTKGQVATEFFLYIGVFLFVVIASYVVISYVQSSELPSKEAAVVRQVGTSIAESVTAAARLGNGYSNIVPAPKMVLGKKYEVQFDQANKRMILEWKGNYGNVFFSYPLPSNTLIFTDNGCLEVRSNVIVLRSERCKSILKIENKENKVVLTHES